MSGYYLLEPSVYGEMGEDTVLDNTVHPPIVRHLHFVLDAPPRDDLHTSFPCFMVSGRLGRHIAEIGLTGAEVTGLDIDTSEQYGEMQSSGSDPDPEVLWLKVHGAARAADFGLDGNGSLIVSAAALEALRRFRLEECRIYDAEKPPTKEQVTEDLWAEAQRVADALKAAKKDRP